MTTLATNRSTVASGVGTTSFFARFVSSVIAWNDQRVTRKSLSRLTDRELDDIGLVRGDIETL